MKLSVKLVDDEMLDGKVAERRVSEDELEEMKKTIRELVGSSGAWQLDLETAFGWVCVPGHQIKYVRIDS